MDMHADENGRALSEAAFEVAQWIILAAYIDDDINDRIAFRLVAAPWFIATITPIGLGFVVKVSTGRSRRSVTLSLGLRQRILSAILYRPPVSGIVG